MALTVEDGTGVSDAESLCSVAYADTYNAAIGNAAWATLTTDQKEQSLRKATNYLTGKYGARWAGYRTRDTQALDWPREEVPIKGLAYLNHYRNDIVPKEVKDACASLALRSSAASLVSDEGRRVIREKVDVLETEYSPYATLQVGYPEIDMLLARYLTGGAGSVDIIRI